MNTKHLTLNNKLHGSLKVWIAILVIIVALCNSVLIEHTVETLKREQARYNLAQIKYCYSELALSSEYGLHDIFNICTSKMRTSYTGDVYILDAETLEFVHETSRDVPRDKSIYFTKESVGKYFIDWESARAALSIILLGKNSEEGVNAYYKFDNDIEWLEWKYLPDEFSRFKKYIVVQGIQKDEVMRHFKLIRWFNTGFTILIVLMLLTANTIKKENDE